ADMADPAAIERLFQIAEQELGPLGGLVNNAAYVGQAGRRVASVDVATLRRTFDVNVIGPML
ncbi:MAG: SDR family oxidoreductase, partial [Defluviimonas sp.]|nr:SDR family oxidoreductase [Defluviimonas sp.]